MAGGIAVVTGGSSGIGRVVAMGAPDAGNATGADLKGDAAAAGVHDIRAFVAAGAMFDCSAA